MTKQSIKDFFAAVAAEADKIEDKAEAEIKKGLAAAGLFARSTLAALAKDPAVMATIQGGFAAAAATILSAVETGGASLLPSLCMAEAKNLVINAGISAEHALVPIVAGELHAALTDATAATPEHVNK